MVQPGGCRRVASGGGASGTGVGGARATPPGRDKSSQKKSKGRWMLHEHEQFIVGLAEFGRDWKAIGDIVRTRTAVQIRTHAQKYFQQMEKGRCFPEEPYKSLDGERTDDSRAGESSSSSSSTSSSKPNSISSSAPVHGGVGTANPPDQKLSSSSSSLSASSSSSSSLSASSSSSLSSVSSALDAPTAALLTPQFQARINAGGSTHHPTRRAILTTPAGERGKRLTRPGGPCTVVAVPRATRASSAAAAAAIVAATSATAAATAAAAAAAAAGGNGTDGATAVESDVPLVSSGGDDGDERRFCEGGRGAVGDEFRGGDGKRRKLDRPLSADIVSAATATGAGDSGGMREAMEAAGGSIFAVSHPGWLDQRFRGKRGLVSGTSGGLDLAGMGTGAGGYVRVGLQVDVDLPGMYSDPPIMLSPAFRKADGGSPPWSMIGNMEEGEAAAAMVSGAGVQGVVGWRSDVGSPSRHKSPLFSDTFLEDFLVGGGARDSPDSSDDDPPPPPPSSPLPPPLCASSSSISCSSSISSTSSSSLSSSISSSSASAPPPEASSCPASGVRESGSTPYPTGRFSATAVAGAAANAATAVVTPGNICPSSALPGASGDRQRPTSRAAAATPTSCEGFGYGFAVGPDDCIVARHDADGGFSLDSMAIPLGGTHHEMASNGILGEHHGLPFPQKQDGPWDASTAGGDGRGGGYGGGDMDDSAVFATIHGGGHGDEGVGATSGPCSETGMGSGASAGNTELSPSRLIDFLPFQHQHQSAPSPAGSMLGRAKGATVAAAAAALALSEQQAAAVAAAVHDCFTTSVGGGTRESVALQASLGGRGGIEDGPLCKNWLSYEDVGDSIGAGQDGLSMDADDAEALGTMFAFEDHFGML